MAMRLVALVVLAACGKSAPSGPGATTSQQRIARHVPDVVATVTQYTGMDPTIAMVAGFGAAQAPCWSALVAKVKGSYAFQDASRELSVIILEGDLPRAEVEQCLPEALKSSPFPITIEKDGENAVFVAGEMGKVYATWRDGFLFASTKEGIEAVMTGPRSKEPWPQRLARLPKAQMISASIDPVVGKLFGFSSPGYDLVVDDMEKGRGKVFVSFGSPADAAAAAKQLTENTVKWPPTPPEKLGETLAKLPVTVRGSSVEITFDREAFGALDAEALDGYAKRVRGVLKTP